MNTRTTVKRSYRSPVRAAQAGRTRRAVIAAATRLFVEVGYGATSIDGIAAEAGVSRATVFASVGGKPALLKTAYDVALVGDDEPVSLPERARSRAIRAEPDPRRYLDRYAELVCELGARVAGIYEAIRGAATADPEVRPVWEKIQQERRIGAAHVVADAASKGPLRPGLDRDEAADIVWVLNDAGLYHMLVDVRGWPRERFQEWLASSLVHELLGDEGRREYPQGDSNP
jgi:AcrR family transcriptional regulator